MRTAFKEDDFIFFHYKNYMYFIEYEIKKPFNYDEAVCQHGC
jgi:hypothetical protein